MKTAVGAFRILSAGRTGFAASILLLALVALYALSALSISSAFRDDRVARTVATSGHLFFSRPANAPEIRFERVANVALAVREIEGRGVVAAPVGAAPPRAVILRALAANDLAAMAARSSTLVLEGGLKPGGVVLGRALAAELGLRMGDPVRLTIGAGAPETRLTLSGLFTAGAPNQERGLVYLSAADAPALFADRASGFRSVRVWLTAPERIDASRPVFETLVGPAVRIGDWRDLTRSLTDAIALERRWLFAYASAALLLLGTRLYLGLMIAAARPELWRPAGAAGRLSGLGAVFLAGVLAGALAAAASLVVAALAGPDWIMTATRPYLVPAAPPTAPPPVALRTEDLLSVAGALMGVAALMAAAAVARLALASGRARHSVSSV